MRPPMVRSRHAKERIVPGHEELTRIVFTLTEAIQEARGIALSHGINAEFREVAKHAREMHDSCWTHCSD